MVCRAQRYRATWAAMNPGWVMRLWDDAECAAFVRSEFPEYVDAYFKLPHNVERADFFRYMVVLRYGGLYADIDTECHRPMDELVCM
jgi:mannosyltransferase OCH1-like enzyme